MKCFFFFSPAGVVSAGINFLTRTRLVLFIDFKPLLKPGRRVQPIIGLLFSRCTGTTHMSVPPPPHDYSWDLLTPCRCSQSIITHPYLCDTRPLSYINTLRLDSHNCTFKT